MNLQNITLKLKKIIPSLKKQLREGTEEEPLLEND